MLDRIHADEAKRKRIKEQRNLERQIAKAEGDAEEEHKRIARKAASDAVLEGKIKKTASELQFKDMLAQKELEKVEDARKRRQQLKEIRQEAFDLAAARRKKAMEHEEAQRKQAIKDKDDKCKAIQDGFKTLSQMRNKMKDIMTRTTMELKEEINSMHHKGTVSPDKVMKKSLSITKHSMFPRLKKSFGLVEPTTAAEEARVAEMLEEGEAKAAASSGGEPGQDKSSKPAQDSRRDETPYQEYECERARAHTRTHKTNIIISDEVELARIEAKKAASLSPSRAIVGAALPRGFRQVRRMTSLWRGTWEHTARALNPWIKG